MAVVYRESLLTIRWLFAANRTTATLFTQNIVVLLYRDTVVPQKFILNSLISPAVMRLP
jgi:hypothetical protein